MTTGTFVFMLKDLKLLVRTGCDKHLGHRRNNVAWGGSKVQVHNMCPFSQG